MRDDLGLLFSLMCLIVGSTLLYRALSISDSSQLATLLGGAILLALSFVILWSVARNWLQWRRVYKKYRDS